MNITLENDHLRATLSTRGAELLSLVRLSDQREIIWQADPRYWAGHAPILFPACGGLWDGTYLLESTPWQMPKHGFLSKAEWTPTAPAPGSGTPPTQASLVARATGDSLRIYPFRFALTITYELQGPSLRCLYQVESEETEGLIPFQIGGHPSVSLPLEDGVDGTVGYLQPLGTQGQPLPAQGLRCVRVGQQGCWRPELHPVPATPQGLIPVCRDTFLHEALILDHHQVQGFRVLSPALQPVAQVTSPAPAFLLWQPQGLLSPFVCVEPWYGLCDQEGLSTPLLSRSHTQCAAPGNPRQGLLFEMAVPPA